MDKIKELEKRVKLTDVEIQNIYKERNWLIFSHELFRLQIVAQAQLNKVLNDKDLYVKFYTTRECANVDGAITEYEETVYIPLAEAIKEVKE